MKAWKRWFWYEWKIQQQQQQQEGRQASKDKSLPSAELSRSELLSEGAVHCEDGPSYGDGPSHAYQGNQTLMSIFLAGFWFYFGLIFFICLHDRLFPLWLFPSMSTSGSISVPLNFTVRGLDMFPHPPKTQVIPFWVASFRGVGCVFRMHWEYEKRPQHWNIFMWRTCPLGFRTFWVSASLMEGYNCGTKDPTKTLGVLSSIPIDWGL